MQTQRRLLLISFIIAILLIAVALFAHPIGLDVTDGFGIIQLTELLLGITLLTISAWVHLRRVRPESAPHSLQADIGVRLAGTGLIFSYVTGYADLLRIGTHVVPDGFDRPFVGPLQMLGLIVGILIIMAGLFMYHTSRGNRTRSLFAISRKDQQSEG